MASGAELQAEPVPRQGGFLARLAGVGVCKGCLPSLPLASCGSCRIKERKFSVGFLLSGTCAVTLSCYISIRLDLAPSP